MAVAAAIPAIAAERLGPADKRSRHAAAAAKPATTTT
jgi:hypothetical protein